MDKPAIRIVVGIAAANALALLLFLLNWAVLKYNDQAGVIMIASNFFITPAFMGMLSGFIWHPINYKYWQYVLLSLVNAFVAIVGAAIFLQEGAICLLIVSPLVFVMVIAANVLTIFFISHRKNRLNMSLSGLLVAFLLADLASSHNFQYTVSDTMRVDAAAEKVWPWVVAFPPIEAEPEFWLFTIGLPRPVETTVEGDFEGAGRKCIFSSGAVFDERMSVFQPNENLTFDIIKQPNDPEIIGHINLRRGQFLLLDNHDGTTTLTGTSWYDLNVFPAWYYNLWAETITRNVHLRVMKHIKSLAESNR